MIDETHYSLAAHNTFGMDVRAARFIEYASEGELRCVLEDYRESSLPLLHIGGGSNLLFTKDYDGIVLHSAIREIALEEEDEQTVTLRVGAGVVWDDFVAYAVGRGWYGAENLSLIPGEVGASAVQNIGAYGVEVKDLIVAVDTVCVATGASRRFAADECQYAYRHSIFKDGLKGQYIVTYVWYRLGKQPRFCLDYGNIRAELERQGCEPDLQNLRNVIISIRQAKLPDPQEMGNAGSFFMNPIIPASQFEKLLATYPDMPHYPAGEGRVKVPAGWLIDRCGWKGKSLGKAGVHDKQALVLVNRGGATGEDIIRLADAIVADVRRTYGITIRPEVNFI